MTEFIDMTTKIDRIKEVLKSEPAVIAVSGPSGAGKDYLTQKAMEYFAVNGIPSFNVQMTTERPHRGEVETKTCVSSSQYDKLVEHGLLIGDHVNKVRYGYQVKDLNHAINEAKEKGGLVILELNPAKQPSFPEEMKDKLGTNLTAWIGVETTEEQTRANMVERGESEQTIKERLAVMHEFVEAMENDSEIKICNNGPDNRQNSAKDFIKIIETSILDSQV